MRTYQLRSIVGLGFTLVFAFWGLSAVADDPMAGRLALFYTSNVMGEVDTCGCATKKLGGVAKRVALFSNAAEEKIPLLYFDSGDHFSKTPTIPPFMEAGLKKKADLLVEALHHIKISALTPGERDFAFGLNFLVRSKLPYVSANLVHKKDQKALFDRYKIFTLKGYRIGVVGVISKHLGEMVKEASPEIEVIDVNSALTSVMAELKEKTDLLILLSHQSFEETRQTLQQFPGFDYVIAGHSSEYLEDPRSQAGNFIFEGEMRGKYVGRIDVEIAGKGGFKNNLSARKKAQSGLWFAEEELRGLKNLSKVDEKATLDNLKKANSRNPERLKLVEKYAKEEKSYQDEIEKLGLPASGGFWHELIPIDEEIADDAGFKKKLEALDK